MATNLPTSESFLEQRKKELEVVSTQLRSQRASDIWSAMEQVTRWLQQNPEDQAIYMMLLDAVQEIPDLRERVRNLLVKTSRNGSKSAKSSLRDLPSSVKNILADADDAFYAGEYDDAIELYRHILKTEPDNAQAKENLAKAEIKRVERDNDAGSMRAAEQYYRRARSYIAARDIPTAMNLLNAAIEAAQEKGNIFTDAEEALTNLHNLQTADEFRAKAFIALENEKWEEAWDLFKKALSLDSTNEVTKKEIELLRAALRLRKLGILKIFSSTSQLQNIIGASKNFVSPDNPLLTYIEQQISNIRLTRMGGIIAIIGTMCIISFPILRGIREYFPTPPPPTRIPISTISPTFSNPTVALSTPTSTVIPTNTTFPTLTREVFTQTPATKVLGTGYVNLDFVTVWEDPSGGIVGTVGLYQTVIILDKQEFGQLTYFKCVWTLEGSTHEGWILARYVEFGPAPTP